MTLFCPRSPPFMSSNGIFLQAKWSKIKERVEGWKSGKTSRFKRITVCILGLLGLLRPGLYKVKRVKLKLS